MELTYENMVKWFNDYFEYFNGHAGLIEALSTMAGYFTPECEFWAYNQTGPKPSTREQLLMTMVHPGLHEHLTPREYTIDLKRMSVAVQFQIQFSDEPLGRVWPAKQASTHYALVQDEKGDLKIKKILYFMELRPTEESSYRELWIKYRDEALAKRR